jgi:hypothetical protein
MGTQTDSFTWGTEHHLTEKRPCAHDYTHREHRHIKGISTRGYVNKIIYILCFIFVWSDRSEFMVLFVVFILW